MFVGLHSAQGAGGRRLRYMLAKFQFGTGRREPPSPIYARMDSVWGADVVSQLAIGVVPAFPQVDAAPEDCQIRFTVDGPRTSTSFGTVSRVFPPVVHHLSRGVRRALLGAHARGVLIGAGDPML